MHKQARFVVCCCGWLLLAATMWAQTPNVEPATPPEAQAPSVSFAFAFPGSDPGQYSLTVESSGRAAYRADDILGPNATPLGDPYMVKFVLAPATAQRIFALAKALKYFDGNFEYRGGRIANMGAKTLTYRNGERETRTTYNYTTNQDLQQLTTLFQGIATSLAHGRRLDRLYRFDKLGLEAELKSFEQDVKSKFATELEVDEAILRQIADDPAVMHISRKRAEALLAQIGKEDAAKP